MIGSALRIIQVIPGVGTEAAGPSYSVPGLCRGLILNHVDVSLFASGQVPIPINGVHIYTFKSHVIPILDRGVSHAFYRELLQRSKYVHILHSNGLWSAYNVYPGWVINKYRKNHKQVPKFVVSPRGTLAKWSLQKGHFFKAIFGPCLQYPAIRNVDMFHATSEKEYEEIREQGYRQPVAIVPIGMDVPEFGVSGSGFLGSGSETGKRMKKVVFFGRLHKVKAIDNLILAWEKLCSQSASASSVSSVYSVVRDWQLLIAGPDCGVKGDLERLIAEHHIPGVSFVGELNGQAKYDFLASADIYVLPSMTENFGVTVAEALACGTPVIASQGTPWHGLEQERCGKWVPIGVEPLTVALKEMMLMSDEERAAMGARGREWIRRDFSWKGIGAKMKAAYEWLLAPEKVEKPGWMRVE